MCVREYAKELVYVRGVCEWDGGENGDRREYVRGTMCVCSMCVCLCVRDK